MIRPAETGDIPAIAQVHVRSWQVAYRGLLPDSVLDGLSVQERAERWSRWLGQARTRTLVSERDAQIVGFTRSGPSADLARTTEISHVYLDPAWFGRGVGRELLDAILKLARDDGSERAVLWVLEGNHRARRFYERAGLAGDGERKTDLATLGGDAPELRYAIGLR